MHIFVDGGETFLSVNGALVDVWEEADAFVAGRQSELAEVADLLVDSGEFWQICLLKISAYL